MQDSDTSVLRREPSLAIRQSIPGTLGVLVALAVGWAASFDRLTMIALVGALALVPVALFVGSKGTVLVALAVLPLPLRVSSVGLPVSAMLVTACVILLLFPRREGIRHIDLPRPAWWEIALPLWFLASAVLSLVYGDQAGAFTNVASPFAALLAGVVFYFCVLGAIDSERATWQAAHAIGIAGVVCAMFATIQYFAPSVFLLRVFGSESTTAVGEFTRLSAPMGDYELLAELLAIGAVSCVWLALQAHGLPAIAWSAAGIWCAGAVLATGTRGGVVLVALGLAMIVLFRRQASHRVRLLVIGALGLIIVLQFSSFFGRAGGVFERFAKTNTSADVATLLNRERSWGPYLDQLETGAEYALGFGSGTDFPREYPHSIYVYLLYTQGVIGLLLFATLLATVTLRGVLAVRGLARPVPLELFVIIIWLVAIDGVKIEFVRLPGYQVLIWGVVGLAVGARRLLAPARG